MGADRHVERRLGGRVEPCPDELAEALGGGAQRAEGSRSRSNRARPGSTPETPSTREWWVLRMIANRPSARPSTSHCSHSGLERSSCWDATREASRNSCSWLPGGGSAVWRTWYSRLKLWSSTPSGRRVP